MNVTCSGCPAKYAVPDEKVRGKKVRITCKHCGTNIVVDGTALAAEQSVAAKPAEPVQPAPAEPSYVVGFADDRQETHTVSEIVALYAGGKLDEESLVWRDGMADWLSPFDVPELAVAFRKGGVVRRTAAAASLAVSSAGDDEPTVVGRSPFDADSLQLADAPRVELELDLPREPAKPAAALRESSAELKAAPAAPKAAAVAAKPVAAASRRNEKRAGAVDLFGGVADAGSEGDASLDLAFPQEPEHKLTGARNESSVLFSLDALTKPDAKAAGQKKARDKEQEKQATDALFGDSAPNSLSNIGGGGFSALAAPDFTKPVTALPEPQVRPSDPVEVPNAAPGKKTGAAVWVGAVLGIAAAAGVAFFVMQKKAARDTAPAAAAPDTKAATATPPATPAPEAAAAASEAPAGANAAEAQATSPAESVAQAITAAGAKPAAGAATPTTPTTPTTAGTHNVPAEKPADSKKPDAPAAAPVAAPAADGAAFDKGAAVSALGAAAANAASCKKPEGPTGSGKVSVTFAPSGRATMTNVGGAFAGTDVGGCVARLFRAAKVPPFSGDPVTVSKSFSIE
jgi:predicted Zn finger-like uncharacterized protein